METKLQSLISKKAQSMTNEQLFKFCKQYFKKEHIHDMLIYTFFERFSEEGNENDLRNVLTMLNMITVKPTV